MGHCHLRGRQSAFGGVVGRSEILTHFHFLFIHHLRKILGYLFCPEGFAPFYQIWWQAQVGLFATSQVSHQSVSDLLRHEHSACCIHWGYSLGRNQWDGLSFQKIKAGYLMSEAAVGGWRAMYGRCPSECNDSPQRLPGRMSGGIVSVTMGRRHGLSLRALVALASLINALLP